MTVIHCTPVRDVRRWTPVADLTAEIQKMEKDFDRIFDRTTGALGADVRTDAISPRLDVTENEDGFTIQIELPGVEKKDVKITVTNGVLSVSGEKKPHNEGKGVTLHRAERSFGTFEGSFTLPPAAQSDKIGATFSNGVLTLTVPKPEQAKPREIEVTVK